jgi:hypothetical protein
MSGCWSLVIHRVSTLIINKVHYNDLSMEIHVF